MKSGRFLQLLFKYIIKFRAVTFFFFNHQILNTLILNLSDINVLGLHGLDSVTSCQEIPPCLRVL